MPGSRAWSARKAYAGRSTMTASTLSMGSHTGDTPNKVTPNSIQDFVFRDPEIASDDVLAARVLEWIAHHGPNTPPDQNCGFGEIITGVFQLLTRMESTHAEIDSLKEKVTSECAHIDKAKNIQLSKWGKAIEQPSAVLEKKLNDLNQWCLDKKAMLNKPLAEKEVNYKVLQGELDSQVLEILSGLKGETPDPACDAFVQELASLFEEMSVEEDANVEPPAPEITASSLALQKIQDLPDGAEKNALLAVLQASVPPQALDPDLGKKFHIILF